MLLSSAAPEIHRSQSAVSMQIKKLEAAVGHRLLLRGPRVLLLDEPTAGQDAVARTTLRALLSDCAAEGIAITLATHDLNWAYALCQRWAVLAGGRIAADTDPATVLAQRELLQRARLAPLPVAA